MCHSLECPSLLLLKLYHELWQFCCLDVAHGCGGDVVEKEN